jgi:hypothetical protein
VSAIATRLLAAARNLRAELGANRRLAALLLLVPGVLLIHLALLTDAAIATARADHAALERRSQRLEALARSGDWARRVGEERGRLALWEQEIWRAASPELAAADLQTAVQRMSSGHLAWSRLKLSPPEPLDAIGGWRIKAELNGKLNEGGALALLQELAEHAPHIRIDGLVVAPQRGQTVNVQLSVLVAPGEQAP